MSNQMIFKPKEVTKSKLSTVPVVAGQMITCSDTGELYFDTSTNQRVSISDFIFCETLTDLEGLQTYLTDKFYLVKEDNSIWRYNGSSLIELNPRVSIEEGVYEYQYNTDLFILSDDGLTINQFDISDSDLEYNPLKDNIFIYLNSILLILNIDYTIDNDNNKISFFNGISIDNGDIKLYILIYKNSLNKKTVTPV